MASPGKGIKRIAKKTVEPEEQVKKKRRRRANKLQIRGPGRSKGIYLEDCMINNDEDDKDLEAILRAQAEAQKNKGKKKKEQATKTLTLDARAYAGLLQAIVGK